MLITAFFTGFAVEGLENIPKDGPFLLASNHLSFLDPPALGCRMPRQLALFCSGQSFQGPVGHTHPGLEFDTGQSLSA